MANFNSFEEIIAWQKSRELNSEIYFITNRGDFVQDYGLKNQIRRASISIFF
ncbi:four helix bundle protein [Mesonia maritima]|uniref:Four helix bundle protein n=1 Tax=Mesonia maritima TaxID=1793873 RepID=A0ABU1K387_9FLAO|nr:four helix bundle protein [Mesonia maritima]MDR6300076.1 four helix bundle protein [Mesonia maritima]